MVVNSVFLFVLPNTKDLLRLKNDKCGTKQRRKKYTKWLKILRVAQKMDCIWMFYFMIFTRQGRQHLEYGYDVSTSSNLNIRPSQISQAIHINSLNWWDLQTACCSRFQSTLAGSNHLT